MRYLLLMIGVMLLTACGSSDPTTEAAETELPVEAAEVLPPGYTDAPPPGPTSDTTILSGGTFLLAENIADSVVVISNNTLVAWGPRGMVELPNDSIGMDMRGKWIVAGDPADIENGNLVLPSNVASGDPARLLAFNSDPRTTEDLAGALYAIVSEEGIEVFETESD